MKSAPVWPILLCPALLLSGCTVGPDFKTPAAPASTRYNPDALKTRIPATSTTSAQTLVEGAPVLPRWWTQFQSPALNHLVDMALAANTDIAVADASLRQLQDQAAANDGAQLPSASIGYQAARTQTSQIYSNPVANPTVYVYSLHTLSLSVSYTLDIFGGLRRQSESARATAESAAFKSQAARLTVAANTVVAAINEAALRKKIDATHEGLDAARKVLALMRVQQAAGAIGTADVAAQTVVVAQAEASVLALEKALVAQRAALSILLGRETGKPLPPLVDLDTLTLPADLPVSLPSTLVRQRPDVRASAAAMHSASAALGAAIAARLPSITLSANGGGQALLFADMFKDGNPFWTLAGGVAQTIFNGWALLNQQRAARAALDGAKAQYRAAVLGAFSDVTNALTAVDADARLLSSAETANSAARENSGYLAYQLQLGQVGSLALLNATATRVATATALVDARAARFSDVAALYQALGGGTSP